MQSSELKTFWDPFQRKEPWPEDFTLAAGLLLGDKASEEVKQELAKEAMDNWQKATKKGGFNPQCPKGIVIAATAVEYTATVKGYANMQLHTLTMWYEALQQSFKDQVAISQELEMAMSQCATSGSEEDPFPGIDWDKAFPEGEDVYRVFREEEERPRACNC